MKQFIAVLDMNNRVQILNTASIRRVGKSMEYPDHTLIDYGPGDNDFVITKVSLGRILKAINAERIE